VLWSISRDVEEALWEAARAELPADALLLRNLVPAIIARSHVYTDDRERLRQPVAPRTRSSDLAARALFFTPADSAKVQVPLAELLARELLPPRALRLLDVGAGAGAMTLGLVSLLPGRIAHVSAVDRDPGALAILRRALNQLVPSLPLSARSGDVLALPPGAFDLVVVGSTLNELDAGRRVEVMRALLARLEPDGALIIIEPALRETARDLHALRDEVIGARLAHVFAPCTRQGGCPALDDPRDWCHEDRPFQPTPRLHELMNRTGLRGLSMKFAYLTLRHDASPLVSTFPGRRALRVVSGPLDAKGTVERIVCGATGRERMRKLRRERTQARLALTAAHRGDVLIVEDGNADEMVRVVPATPGRPSFPS
jgi:precorrin-6B methylase 2